MLVACGFVTFWANSTGGYLELFAANVTFPGDYVFFAFHRLHLFFHQRCEADRPDFSAGRADCWEYVSDANIQAIFQLSYPTC
jgi:hypothetical protein